MDDQAVIICEGLMDVYYKYKANKIIFPNPNLRKLDSRLYKFLSKHGAKSSTAIRKLYHLDIITETERDEFFESIVAQLAVSNLIHDIFAVVQKYISKNQDEAENKKLVEEIVRTFTPEIEKINKIHVEGIKLFSNIKNFCVEKGKQYTKLCKDWWDSIVEKRNAYYKRLGEKLPPKVQTGMIRF